ncbi:hypothetical protein V1478_011265 [Vespula squamosa]|uniref:Uncharacterized protein n=1 Tax=Vespula squamosa TaxID=30214 RepID=A0ABD2AE04_VESSQ
MLVVPPLFRSCNTSFTQLNTAYRIHFNLETFPNITLISGSLENLKIIPGKESMIKTLVRISSSCFRIFIICRRISSNLLGSRTKIIFNCSNFHKFEGFFTTPPNFSTLNERFVAVLNLS